MTTRLLARRSLAVLLAAVGTLLCFVAGWIAAAEIRPQVLASGWSLEGSNLILDRDWWGHQLYLRMALYGLVGSALVLVGVWTWGGWRSGR